MKIAIMADSHDNWNYLDKAVAIANQQNCEILLFAGDLISPPGLSLLEKFSGEVKFVWGNNEAERMGLTRKMDVSEKIELCGDIFEAELDGVKIFMNHYPRFVELAAKSGEFHLCIHGHTHQYHETKIGECLLLDPGEIQGYKTGKPSFAIFDTKTKTNQPISIS